MINPEEEAASSFVEKYSSDLPFLAYIVQILAKLPYDVQEEPLQIIYQINRLVSLQGRCAGSVYIYSPSCFMRFSALSTKLKEMFEKIGYKKGANDELVEPGEVLRAELQAKCTAGFSFTLLIKLKHYLKAVYYLSDSKCHGYSPHEGTKVCCSDNFLS